MDDRQPVRATLFATLNLNVVLALAPAIALKAVTAEDLIAPKTKSLRHRQFVVQPLETAIAVNSVTGAHQIAPSMCWSV